MLCTITTYYKLQNWESKRWLFPYSAHGNIPEQNLLKNAVHSVVNYYDKGFKEKGIVKVIDTNHPNIKTLNIQYKNIDIGWIISIFETADTFV